MKRSRKWTVSMIALALVCTLIGTGLGLHMNLSAVAEGTAETTETTETTTTVVTSPFTAAVAAVKDSVVGVNNYQTVRYSNSNYGWGNWGSWGYGWGDSWGNGSSSNYDEQEVLYATGSGVVIATGYVLTNYHVVEDATKLTVSYGEDEYTASLVAYDENLDVAILYAQSLNAAAVTLGDSDSLQVGDWAICIGNPLSDEFSGSVTVGIVSGLNRAISTSSTDKYGRKETVTNTMIQTDAAINNGNSGGGMFNVNGELVGIPTLKYSGTAYSGATIDGIGLCIPINAAKPLIEEALSGKVTASAETTSADSTTATASLAGKPRMGVTVTDVENFSSAAISNGILPDGAYVVSVDANGPAAAAGLQAGDIIVEVNGTVVSSTEQLQGIIGGKSEGDVLQVKVYRCPNITTATSLSELEDGEYIDTELTLAVVDGVAQ